QKISSVLNRLTTKANYRSGGDFSKLEIPFKTVATDVVSGDEVILDKGSISEAMRATMAFPLALTAVERDGQILMDGGMVNPVPVNLVKQMGDSGVFVVAINTVSRLDPKENLKTPVDIAGQVTTIMTSDRLKAQLKLADFIIEPPLEDFESADFDFKDSLIEIGYQAGFESAEKIIKAIEKKKDTSKFFVGEVTIRDKNSSVSKAITAQLLNKSFTDESFLLQLKHLSRNLHLFEIDVSKSHNSKGNGSALRIDYQPDLEVGECTFIMNGVTIYSTELLAVLLVDNHGQLNSSEFKKGLKRIEDKYAQDGYDVSYVRSADIDFDKKQITLQLDEGIIRSIDVDDNTRTRDWLVRSYFPMKNGQPFSSAKAGNGLDNLYGTDLFEQILVELVPVETGARVRIRVKERHYTQLRLGWHWDDDYKSEQFLELLDDNIRGMGLEYLIHAQYAEDRQKYFGQLKMDRIWFSYLTAKINIYYQILDRFIYDGEGKEIDLRKERRTGFEFSLGQQVKRFGTVRGAFISERVKSRYDRTTVGEEFSQRILHLESIIETFDRLSFPNTGKKFQSEIRFAGEYLGGDFEYTRFFSSLEGYFPIGKYINFHPKASLGLSGSVLPVSEQFYIGGAKSFSGYRANEYGGDKVILLNNELRFRLPLNLYLIGRYDVGQVYVHTEDIKLENVRNGWGAFAAFKSPIGPLEIGYGAADSDNDRFYVNIGLSF
ncbi:MAG TPA: BamA/TamA family outer membrane protein, partial [candidate division Zixibacteria bacterium]|nr:BamA/TamA family outer membrane protein [candidate division Zixibacteria bacterium]